MNAFQPGEEPTGTAARNMHWLTALEQALKSRVGWVDEAVSPFASRRRAQDKIKRQPLPTDKAA